MSAKFKSGAGAIIAFFLVTVIFSTLVGVVFISINQSPSKRPEASGAPGGYPPSCTFSPSETTGGSSVSVTSLGGLEGEVVLTSLLTVSIIRIPLGNIEAGATSSFVIPAGTAIGQYGVRVGSFGVSCKTKDGSETLKIIAPNLWNLQNKVEGRKVTFSYTPPSNSEAFNAIVVEDVVSGEVRYDSGGLANGSTSHVWDRVAPGKYVAKMFAFGIALVSNESPFEVVAPGCTIGSDKAVPGGTIKVTSVGQLSGSISLMGAYQTPIYSKLGNLPAGGSTSIVVPKKAQLGLYVVRVGGVGEVGVGCKPDLAVNAPNKCDFNKDAVLNKDDQDMMTLRYGKVVPGTDGGAYDLNGDKYVNSGDQAALAQAVMLFPTATKFCY